MEKRFNQTRRRYASVFCVCCVKFLLVCALFVPALLSFEQFSESRRAATERASIAEIAQKPRPKDLVKIYSIVTSHRPDVSQADAWRMAEVILQESSKRRLDALLVLALIQVESGFQNDAVSPSGARGLMQIMPETARSLIHVLRSEYGLRPVAFRPESLDDPLLNIRLGVYYLHGLKSQFRSLTLALSAYNFGPSEIQSRLENKLDLPSEFADLVLDAYRRYQNAKHPSF